MLSVITGTRRTMIRLIKQAHNLHRLELFDIDIWFSYETAIAYKNTMNDDFQITKNIWSSTTGKHLNMINPDKSIRVDNHEFNKLLQKAVNA